MSFIKVLKSTAKLIHSKKISLFTYDVRKQKSYLEQFNEPKDDIERSYFQYKCQMQLLGKNVHFLLNFASFFLSLFYLFRFVINFKSESSTVNETWQNAFFITDGKPKNILPKDLSNKFPEIYYGEITHTLNLNVQDRKFIFNIIKRYPFSWHFIFKCLLKVAMYSSIIDRKKVKALIVCSEYTFTSSLLTSYCETRNVEHINIMHGEKLFYIRDSFFRFHKCYIWDDFYKQLFIQLRANPDQFTVALPESINFVDSDIIEKKYDFTYYLGGEQESDLLAINNSLVKLSNKGFEISIRPHPRYTDLNLVNKIFPQFEIEDCKNITIEESIFRTGCAISLYSTVLNQAIRNGVEIVIDDLTNPKKYNRLIDLQYVMLSKKHTLISNLVEDNAASKNNKVLVNI